MLRILCFVLCFCGMLNALTLQEAVALTLQNNPSIKEQEFLLQESKASYQAYQSPFYPSFNLNYGALKSNRIQRLDKKTSGNFGGNLQYNLFNGFSDVYALKSAKALMESQDYQLDATKEDVILLVKSAYINVLRQEQNVRIAEQSKTLLEEQRRQNAEFYRVGLIQKNDLLKIEVKLNNVLQDLLAYKSALNYALRNLERYIKMQITKESLEVLRIKEVDLDFNALKVDMLQKRSELLFIDKIIESKGHLTQSAKGNFLPKVDVKGAYTRFGDDYKLSGREGVYNDETNVQVVMNFNVFSGFRDKFNVESLQMNYLAFVSKRATLLEDLELQLFNALENYNLARNALEISKIALVQAEENYRISKNRYTQRIETTSDFLDAELSLTQARSNLALNHYAIMESLVQLERITQTQLMIVE